MLRRHINSIIDISLRFKQKVWFGDWRLGVVNTKMTFEAMRRHIKTQDFVSIDEQSHSRSEPCSLHTSNWSKKVQCPWVLTAPLPRIAQLEPFFPLVWLFAELQFSYLNKNFPFHFKLYKCSPCLAPKILIHQEEQSKLSCQSKCRDSQEHNSGLSRRVGPPGLGFQGQTDLHESRGGNWPRGGRCHGQLPPLRGHWIGHERLRGPTAGPLWIWVSILVTSARESKRVPLSRLAALINLAPNQAHLKGGGEDKRAAHLFSLDSNPEIIRWLLQDLKQIKFERAKRAALNSWLR